jgi:uncharacterized protein YvpB
MLPFMQRRFFLWSCFALVAIATMRAPVVNQQPRSLFFAPVDTVSKVTRLQIADTPSKNIDPYDRDVTSALPAVRSEKSSSASGGATPIASETIGKATPTPLPWRAYIDPIYGQPQQLHLDCEARAAVDWAAFFRMPIDELAFFRRIPAAANPDDGFVGDVNDSWGRLPPSGYGVHAGPVARVLRLYSLSAFAYRGLAYDQLRSQIAARHPVIVWVVGHVGLSKPVVMELGGRPVTVAPYEHVVLFIGYEYQKAVVLDGARRYSVDEIDFRNSGKILGNMASVAEPLVGTGAEGIPFEDLNAE